LKSLLKALVAIAGLLMLAPASVHAGGPSGTGVLFMYSDSSCSTLLPRVSGGTMGYLLPSTGTTVYVQIKGISELTDGGGVISMQYTPYADTLSTTISGTSPNESTSCTPWVVGNFDTATGVAIACGQTGVVFYGQTSPDYKTKSNGGADGGHFFGPGTSSGGACSSSVPEFPSGLALVVLALPLLLVLRRLRFSESFGHS
jgi:hypothetical protein